jgi:hypothetical protein
MILGGRTLFKIFETGGVNKDGGLQISKVNFLKNVSR